MTDVAPARHPERAHHQVVARNGRVHTRLPKIYTRELVDVIFEQPYCRIGNLVDKGIAKRQAASRYLHDLGALGYCRRRRWARRSYLSTRS